VHPGIVSEIWGSCVYGTAYYAAKYPFLAAKRENINI
jgi:hypothetical protein